ncbi:MAG: accessory factor UbiK family protein [Pseudomonadota bacterium]|nr:accessory factor UbiK family protein [Pseudomonadota bacterium]
MIDPKQIEDAVLKISQTIPNGFGEVPEGLKSQIKSILTASLDKMDIVTRDEFDVQKAVLTKTRAKVDALEKKVAELESTK